MRRIALEEHFFTEEYVDYLRSRKDYPRLITVEDEDRGEVDQLWQTPLIHSVREPDVFNGLLDLGEGRLRVMDKAGIDMQVLSLATPGPDAFEPSDGTMWAKKSNDELAKVIETYPDRFAGFAALAPQDPMEAVDELERAVKELGFKGTKLNTHVGGEFLDENKYWTIFEKAEELGVPVYFHPSHPAPDMLKPYATYPGLWGSLWGYGAAAGLCAMRLILSGVFDKYPRLKVIFGHLGEALPFWLWRLDGRWRWYSKHTAPGQAGKKPTDYVKENFFVTPSGMLYEPAFLCTYLALGANNILFAVDYPYESSEDTVAFIEQMPICDGDKEKIYHLNAERLMAL